MVVVVVGATGVELGERKKQKIRDRGSRIQRGREMRETEKSESSAVKWRQRGAARK